MAVIGAAPGSPYQPVLTPNGRPKGPLKDLAVELGLARWSGNGWIALSTLVVVLAVAATLWLAREAFRGRVGVVAVAFVVLVGHVAVLFVPLLYSRDVYSYAFYGRIAGIYGGNPYVETPLDHSGDLLWNFVGPKWVDTRAVYGPAWTRLSAELSLILPKPVDHVEAYRFIAIAASLAICVALTVIVHGAWPARTAFALAIVGANPVVLFHSAASGHNDLLMILAVVVGLGLVLRGHDLAAVGALSLGALVKAPAALPLLLLVVWAIARRPPGERARTALTHVGLAVVLGLAFAVPFLQWEDPTLGMLELSGHEGWLAPSATASRLLDVVSFGTLGWVARLAFATLFFVLLGGMIREVARRAPTMSAAELGATWGWSLLLLALLGPVLLPWYAVWTLPLVWLLPRPPRGVAVATGALLAVTLWSAEPLRFPGAFDVNLFIGRVVVTPILLVMTLVLAHDLRNRIAVGFAFEDETSPSALRAPLPAPQARQQVAAASGQEAGGDPPGA
jgi:alpha-1,6-mannosyltransferase